MESFPWEPPDGGRRSEWDHHHVGVGDNVGVNRDDGGVPSTTSRCEFGASTCGLGGGGGGHGWEVRPGREGDGYYGAAGVPGSDYSLGVAGGVVLGGSAQEVVLAQLDLGLSDTTRYSSYSKLWRTLYFVNDAPFRIRKYHGCNGGAGVHLDQGFFTCRRQLGTQFNVVVVV